jgi:invasion protein IalB
MQFEILMAVKVSVLVFWVATPYELLSSPEDGGSKFFWSTSPHSIITQKNTSDNYQDWIVNCTDSVQNSLCTNNDCD